MRLPQIQIRSMFRYLADKEKPVGDDVEFHKEDLGGNWTTLKWEDDDIRVCLQDWKNNSIWLDVYYKRVGNVCVEFEARDDSFVFSGCKVEVYNPSCDQELWQTFWFIVNILHDEFGGGETK